MKITRKTIEEMTGIKSRRTEFYILQGLYDGLVIGGRGTATEFKERHVVETYLSNELRENGIELAMIKKIIGQFRGINTFTNEFDDTGRFTKKNLYTGKRQRKVYAAIYDRSSDVELWFVGNDTGKLPELSMKNRTSVLIIDVSEVYRELAKP